MKITTLNANEIIIISGGKKDETPEKQGSKLKSIEFFAPIIAFIAVVNLIWACKTNFDLKKEFGSLTQLSKNR